MGEAGTVTFLLVEDDEVDILAVKRALSRLKVMNQLVVAHDGVEALELLRGDGGPPEVTKPYLILLDLNMPRMNGIEFLGHLRETPRHRDAIVFVMTTSEREEDLWAAYANHVAGYIVKAEIHEGFMRAIEMIDCYWRVVEFP